MTLEEQLKAIMKEHNLNAISLHVNTISTGREKGRLFISVNAHGKARNNLPYCSGSVTSAATFMEAVGSAIDGLNHLRGNIATQVDELSPMEEKS